MAIVSGGISYDAGTGDSLTLNTAPANTVPIGVPIPFTVTALGPSLTPAGNVTVTFSVVSGNATLSCGAASCSTTASGDGVATINVTAPAAGASVVTASLTNGVSLQAHFTGGTPPSLAAITPTLSVAAGSTVNWTTQALALINAAPAAGQTVAWQTGGSIKPTGSPTATTNSSGIATKSLTVGPLAGGQQTTSVACLNGTSQCVNFVALGARPEYAWLESISGTAQTLPSSGTPGIVTLRVRDMNGNPMAGGAVTLYQSLYAWTPPCPPHGRCGAGSSTRHANRDRHLRPRWHRHLFSGFYPRRCHQPRRTGRHRKLEHPDHSGRTASINNNQLNHLGNICVLHTLSGIT